MDDGKEIQKKQIQMAWDYSKVEADFHCRVYLQIFVVVLTVGFSIVIAGFTEPLKGYSIFTTFIGSILIFASFYCVLKINELTSKLHGFFDYLLAELEKLK